VKPNIIDWFESEPASELGILHALIASSPDKRVSVKMNELDELANDHLSCRPTSQQMSVVTIKTSLMMLGLA